MAAPMVQVNVRIDPGLYVRVKRRALSDNTTVTAVVNAALSSYILKGAKP